MRRQPLALASALLCALLVPAQPASAQNAAVTVAVDANANRHPIGDGVYGLAYADSTTLLDLNCPLNRRGGNNTSRYNWQQNADNRGADWYFESIAESSATPGQRGDDFVLNSRAGGAEPMITVPIIEYVAKVGANRSKLASFDRLLPTLATYSMIGMVTIGSALPARLLRTKSSPRCPGVALDSAMLSKYQSAPRLSALSCQL